MGRLDYHELTIRKRPHFQPLEAKLFVTFRLAESIPKSVVHYYKQRRGWLKDQLAHVRKLAGDEQSIELASWLADIEKLDREWFMKCEDILHREALGPTWMRDERVSNAVAENLHRLDGEMYRLDAFSVMSNHVHSVFQPLVDARVAEEILRAEADMLARIPSLAIIMHSLKGRSARECNLILGRSGSFWERESFDRVIRAGRFDSTIRYVLRNPVKVGLVQHWQDFRWNYCRKELIDRFL